MATPNEHLTLQMMEWIVEQPRPYRDVVEAWKTSCPRLAIWEDACAAGLIDVNPQTTLVSLSRAGHKLLRHQLLACQPGPR
ncbi:MAG: hypothetical protein IH604_06390 [Burkholderiales bacterium]|nr:hypothetical protein [Burkholderiales bacterium]